MVSETNAVLAVHSGGSEVRSRAGCSISDQVLRRTGQNGKEATRGAGEGDAAKGSQKPIQTGGSGATEVEAKGERDATSRNGRSTSEGGE